MNEALPIAGRSFRKRKRPSRPSWKDLPSYLDKSATVSVSLFASRRLPELKDLQTQLRTAEDQNERQYGSRCCKGVQPEDALRSGGAKTSSRHLRRRTTAVERKKHKHRFPLGDRSSSHSTTRKAKRSRKSTLLEGHFEWRRNSNVSTDDTTTITKSKVHWLATHLWHAKRFHMETLWEWRVPLCHSNRGARAVLRLEQEQRCSLQDITWKRKAVAISSTLSLSLLVPLLSRICPEFAASRAVLAGIEMGSGMLHHLDQFPMNAIGPIRWVVSKEREAEACCWIVQFFVHPSIYSSLVDNLRQLTRGESEIQMEDSPEIIGSSCFRVCGSSSTDILRHALQPKHDEETRVTSWNWCKVPSRQEADTCLRHGSIFSVTVDPGDSYLKAARRNPVDDSPSLEDLKTHMVQVHKHLEHVNLEKEKDDGVYMRTTKKNKILLIWQAPRKLNCLPNHAVSGWEIHCSDPTLAKAIWMKLVLAGPCCPMGMAEESHLRLECSPPMLMFPRDYVDTEQGRLYWNGENPSWNVVRRLWEGGWGRLPIKSATVTFSPTRWNRLVSIDYSKEDENVEQMKEKDPWSIQQEGPIDESSKEEDEETSDEIDCTTVVVRGAFIQPFLQALQGCGQQPKEPSIETKQQQRTNHRRARPLNEMLKAPPLSKQQSITWKESCFGLRSSLSLPALLVCHVQVADKGVLQSGDKVYFGATCLGYVTTASFSLGRGTCHGLAMAGAARLLHALESSNREAGRHVRLLDGARSLQLAVTFHTGEMRCKGSLFIV